MRNLAAIVYLAAPRDRRTETIPPSGTPRINLLIKSISTVVQHFNYGFPIIIFHEDYTEKDKRSIRSMYSYLNISFEKVDFSLPEHIDKDKLSDERREGYRMMCRFFTGVMQNHPALDDYEYYIRLDDDSFFMNPSVTKTGNLVQEMKENDFHYLFRSWYEEPTGLSKIKKIYNQHGGDVNPEKWQAGMSVEQSLKIKMLEGFVPYNNFHISKIDWWRSAQMKDICEKAEGWIMYEDIWDSSLHALFLCLFLKGDQYAISVDWGYRHNIHVSILSELTIKHDPDWGV